MNNINSFKEFKMLKEAKEFTNDTSWKESVLGQLVNGIFGGIFSLLKKGYKNGSFRYLVNKIKKEYLKGIIIWADKNNINLETGESISNNINSNTNTDTEINTNSNTNLGTTAGNNTAGNNTNISGESLTDKKLKSVSKIDDIIDDKELNPVYINKDISEILSNKNAALINKKNLENTPLNPKDKNAKENRNKQLDSIDKEIQEYNNDINTQKENINKIKNKIKELGYNVDDYGIITDKSGKELNKFISVENTVNNNISNSNIDNEKTVNFDDIKTTDEKLKEKNIIPNKSYKYNSKFHKNGRVIVRENGDEKNKKYIAQFFGEDENGNEVKEIWDLSDPKYKNFFDEIGDIKENNNYTEEFLLLEAATVGGLFKKDKIHKFSDEINDVELKKINFSEIAKKINKDEAAKYVNAEKVLSYQLAAEKLYTSEKEGVNKKEELTWKKLLNKIKAEFRDLINVDKVDPTSSSFSINRNESENKPEIKDRSENLITSLETANESKQLIDKMGLDDKSLSVSEIKKGVDNIYIMTIKWTYTGKKRNIKTVLASKFFGNDDYNVFFILDTFSADFCKNFDITNNPNITNNGDVNFYNYLFGQEYVTNKTYKISNIKDKISILITEKLKLPQSTLYETNKFYIFDILDIDGKLDIFVPKLTTNPKIPTKLVLLSEDLKDNNPDTGNLCEIDIYSVFNIKEENKDTYIKVPNINYNGILSKFSNELKVFFEKISKK